MTDLQLLFVVLVVLYAWECACWLRRGSVAFRTWFGRRWTIVHPGNVLGNQRGGFVLAPPLPPLGNLVVASQLPISLSPDAVLSHVATSVNPGGRPPQAARFFPFDKIQNVEARAKKLLVNGELLLRTGSAAAALRLAQSLQSLIKVPPAKRAQAIEQLYRDSLDVKAIERRWQEFQTLTRTLDLLTNLLFGLLFVFTPLVIWRFGFSRNWPALLGALLAATLSITLSFRKAHRRLFPEAVDERFSHCLMLLLYPALAIRARDLLSRPLLEPFHPLALAKVFCPEHDFRDFAARMLRELHYPALPLCPLPEPAACDVERRSRTTLTQAVEAFLRQSRIKPEDLLKPPQPADDTCCSFCPRCLAEFTTTAGACADCGGVALLPLRGERVVTSK